MNYLKIVVRYLLAVEMTISIGLLSIPNIVEADGKANSIGKIEFEGQYDWQMYDPENPAKPVDPVESPHTDGELRIDFAPQLQFGSHKSSNKASTYFSDAQLLHNGLGARANYIQISDYRGNTQGWTLQLMQEGQFQNENKKELKGALLSFDYPWANSIDGEKNGPLVSRDIIQLDKLNQSYQVAEAKAGSGSGVWFINFGSSGKMSNHKNTLVPSKNQKGKPVLNPNFENQQIFQNQAISLTVPKGTPKDSGTYTTVLTWILSELP